MIYVIIFIAGAVVGIVGYEIYKCARVAIQDEKVLRNRVKSWPRAK